MISVIIPAHNEERVLGRSLSTLLADAGDGEFEVIVVPNGCTDRTAEISRSFGVKVIDCPVASKSHALNVGDAAASGFPRFYMDADIVVSADVLREVASAMSETGALAAAPQLKVDYAGSSFGVRAFYDVWTQLPYFTRGMVGSGVYALSEMGRKRFERFPGIIADDGYVRLLFSPEERMSVAGCHFMLTAPKNLRSLIGIKTRAHYGTYELLRYFPELQVNDGKSIGSSFKTLLGRPDLWPKAPIYAFVMGMAKLRARWRLRFGQASWDRDETSRQ